MITAKKKTVEKVKNSNADKRIKVVATRISASYKKAKNTKNRIWESIKSKASSAKEKISKKAGQIKKKVNDHLFESTETLLNKNEPIIKNGGGLMAGTVAKAIGKTVNIIAIKDIGMGILSDVRNGLRKDDVVTNAAINITFTLAVGALIGAAVTGLSLGVMGGAVTSVILGVLANKVIEATNAQDLYKKGIKKCTTVANQIIS